MDTTGRVGEHGDGGAGPSGAPGGDEEELRLGSTERGIAANGVILALTRAARSFLLYDPANEAIRHFLQALRTTVESYLATWQELPLVVRPFELVVGGEVVYLDRDRERSLAFRLYRDGVRRITLQVGLTWQEVLKLLEILSIRYTGVRQTEDDMVVLLWKAGFENIQLEAVEGFVPEDEVGDAGVVGMGGPSAGRGGHVEAPADFDLPVPVLRAKGPTRFRPINDTDRERVLAEDNTQALPELCVKLCRGLLAAVADPADPMELAEIVSQLREIRDFLLAEGLLTSVLEVVRLLAAAPFSRPGDAHERDVLLASFGDERALGRLLHSVPRNATVAPPEMIALLELLPGNHLRAVVELLGTERGEASRRVARSLIERWVPRHGEWILQQLATADPAIAVELLRALAAADPGKAVEGAQVMAGRSELDAQLEALRVLEHAASGPVVARVLQGLAAASNEEVRVRALELIGRVGIRTAFQPLVDRMRGAALRLSPREAEAAGEAIARCDPTRAMDVFRDWLKPRGIFSSVLPGQTMLLWAGVSGLVFVPGDEAETLIKHTADRAGSELARHCTACMVKRRRVARGAR